jgi:hypothetical protein
VENDGALMSFNTWRAVQPDAERSGLVLTANDHVTRACSVWWAGPETDFLDRMRAEARSRGIRLVVHPAPYSRQTVEEAAHLIFGASEQLARLGFDLQAVSGPKPDFLGLTVVGAVFGDEQTEQLPTDLVTSVHGAIAGLLQHSPVRADDVRVEYGRRFLL